MNGVFRKTSSEVLKTLDETEAGLNTDEVHKRREQHSYNELEESKRKNVFQIFVVKLKDFLVIIFIVAALISAFLDEIENAIVIMIVVVLNPLLERSSM